MLAENPGAEMGKGDGPSINLVSVAQATEQAPVAELPTRGTRERQQFAAAANAECARLVSRLANVDFRTDAEAAFRTAVDEWSASVERIAALEPPREDARAVREFLRGGTSLRRDDAHGPGVRP